MLSTLRKFTLLLSTLEKVWFRLWSHCFRVYSVQDELLCKILKLRYISILVFLHVFCSFIYLHVFDLHKNQYHITILMHCFFGNSVRNNNWTQYKLIGRGLQGICHLFSFLGVVMLLTVGVAFSLVPIAIFWQKFLPLLFIMMTLPLNWLTHEVKHLILFLLFIIIIFFNSYNFSPRKCGPGLHFSTPLS